MERHDRRRAQGLGRVTLANIAQKFDRHQIGDDRIAHLFQTIDPHQLALKQEIPAILVREAQPMDDGREPGYERLSHGISPLVFETTKQNNAG
jgi:hypothetical protein